MDRVAVLLVSLLSCSTLLAEHPYFSGIGDLPGGDFESYGTAISSDGRTVVGRSVSDRSGWNGESMYWNIEKGLVAMGNFPGQKSYESDARDVSDDGLVIVGVGTIGSHGEAYRWTGEDGMVSLGDLPGGEKYSAAWAISGDGRVVVGESISDRSKPYTEAFRWTIEEGLVPLVQEFDRTRYPRGASSASRDGSIIVGTANGTETGYRAFRWTEDDGMVLLGTVCDDCENFALAASADGTIIVGHTLVKDGTYQPFRWTAEQGMVTLGHPNEAETLTRARDVSDDGEIIVGDTGASGSFIWDRKRGVRCLKGALEDEYGLDLSGWTLAAYGISGDGRTITGWGVNPNGDGEAFIAHLGSFDPGDTNCDYEVDFNDIDAFVLALTDPAEYDQTYDCDIKLADINRDGSIDFNDIDGFVECLVNGGCQ